MELYRIRQIKAYKVWINEIIKNHVNEIIWNNEEFQFVKKNCEIIFGIRIKDWLIRSFFVKKITVFQ